MTIIIDDTIDVSQLLGARASAVPYPKSMPMFGSTFERLRPLMECICSFGGEKTPKTKSSIPVGLRVSCGNDTKVVFSVILD